MDESSLRGLLDRAIEPEPPIGPLASAALSTGVRIRRRRLVLGAAASAAAVAVAAVSLAAVTLTGAPGRPPVSVSAPAKPAPGPSAGQLARGHWVRIPPAPLKTKMCDNLAVWDGSGLVVIQGPSDGCPLRAAEYNPRANQWTTIAAPPLLKGQSAVVASGGGQVILVVSTGATYSWRQATDRWQPLPTLPAGRNSYSVTWTGSTFVVTRYHWTTAGPVQAFELNGGRWKRLPDLPEPATGRMQESPAVVFHGSVYVLASIMVTHHTDQNGQPGSYETGYTELLRLTTAGWTRVPLGPGGPKSDLALTQVNGAILAAGSSCGWCMEDTGIAVLLRPGSQRSVLRLKPPPGMPYPSNVAGGARAIVVTYSTGIGGLPGRPEPPRGACYIYDIATGAWQPGPTAPASPRISGPAYWTPYGIITLGESYGGKVPALARIGGWLLRPAASQSAGQ